MSLCECGCGEDAGVYARTDRRIGAVRGQDKRYANGHSHSPTSVQNQLTGRVAELVAESGFRPEEIANISKVSLWESGDQLKASVKITPTWADGPDWPVVQPADPVTVKYASNRMPNPNVWTTILLPDPQIGFWRLSDGTLIPMHDEAAIEVALALIEYIRPNVIVNLGDFLDFAEWSLKFAQYPEFSNTTQAAVDYGYNFLARQKSAAGPGLSDHYLIEGNHDDRIPRLIAKNAMAAMRLHRADAPGGWPVLSVPNLLCLDTLDVQYVSGYPAGRLKLADAHGRQTALYALHGEKLDMQKQAKAERQSTVQGHAHHVASATETYSVDGEPKEVESHSMGCLCAVDGRVPSTLGSPDIFGRPVERHESWQQAIGILRETDRSWDLETVRIRDGFASYDNHFFEAA